MLEGRVLPALDYAPLDISAFYNARYHDLQPTCVDLPAGDVTLGGVPFEIGAVGNNTWFGLLAPGFPPRIIDIPVGVAGVDEVHTLINTAWGEPGPFSYAALEFHGSEGSIHHLDLVGNVDIRDFFYGYWTQYINNTTTTNVAITYEGQFLAECRMDKQQIDLPDSFLTETLEFIRVIDSGDYGFQNVLLTGITLGLGAPSEASDLIAVDLSRDLNQGGVNFSYEVAQSPLSQDTTVALYWASGPNLEDRLGGPVYTAPAETLIGQYGPYHVPAETLDAQPGATHLLLVMDPDNLVEEADELNNLVALAIPHADIAMWDATTMDFRTISLQYSVADWAAPPFRFRAYLSSDARFDAGDQPLGGQLDVTAYDQRAANPDGSAQHYLASFSLSSRAPISASQRFVLVVADPDGVAEPQGDPSRANNTTYVVPLFRSRERMNRLGQKGVVSNSSEETHAVRGSGPYTGAILRGTDDFRKLKSTEGLWGTAPFVYGLQNERKQWQREEDKLVQESLLGPLDRLAQLIRAELSRLGATWSNRAFSINEAYDSTRAHGSQSLHYEARALNLDVRAPNGRPDALLASRLAGLVWMAGFDWVRLETNGHVHASAQASFKTAVDPHSLQQAVAEGFRLGLITRQGVARSMIRRLERVEAALENGNFRAAERRLNAFREAVLTQRRLGAIDKAFAAMLVGNTDILLDQLPPPPRRR